MFSKFTFLLIILLKKLNGFYYIFKRLNTNFLNSYFISIKILISYNKKYINSLLKLTKNSYFISIKILINYNKNYINSLLKLTKYS